MNNKMSTTPYYRLFGQSVILALHGGNSVTMYLSMQDQELMKDRQIKIMTSMQSHYMTVWNIVFQIAYFTLAFACDFLTVTGRDSLIPKSIRKLRQTFFSSIIFPVAATIFTLFWPIFLVKRDLIFPEFIDKIFSFNSNMVMHFCILPAALWELVFSPVRAPKNHRLNLGILVSMFLIYITILLNTYNQRQLFPYPMFNDLYGTIYFPIFLLFIIALAIFTYSLQWKVHSSVWGQETTKNTNRNRKVKSK